MIDVDQTERNLMEKIEEHQNLAQEYRQKLFEYRKRYFLDKISQGYEVPREHPSVQRVAETCARYAVNWDKYEDYNIAGFLLEKWANLVNTDDSHFLLGRYEHGLEEHAHWGPVR